MYNITFNSEHWHASNMRVIAQLDAMLEYSASQNVDNAVQFALIYASAECAVQHIVEQYPDYDKRAQSVKLKPFEQYVAQAAHKERAIRAADAHVFDISEPAVKA